MAKDSDAPKGRAASALEAARERTASAYEAARSRATDATRKANEQLSMGRTFPFKENRFRFEVRVEMFNAFNRVTLPAPTATNPGQTVTRDSTGRQTGGYGFIDVVNGLNGARTGQLVARIQW